MSGVPTIKFFSEITAADRALVGGKGCNLALLRQAGFPVPDGFCLAVTAFTARHEISPDVDAALRAAYERLSSPPVAVRSSALAEDSEAASFAGAHESILNVRGLDALREAVRECRRSADTDRARVYRREHGLDDSAAAMAVVVQAMVDAQCAGVCFTVNPHGANDQRVFIEAAHGLGDRVVSGEVMPDLFIVARDGKKIDQRPNNASPLTDDQAQAVAQLALRVERFFHLPQDIEWAARDGEFFLLQARPITTSVGGDVREMEAIRQREIAALRACAEADGTIWSNFNLAEVLPAPLPLTWSLMSHFMSADGVIGRTLGDLGLLPGGPAREGVVQLICGRTYFNLSRELHLMFSGFPLEHNFQAIKADPAKASYPRPTVTYRKFTLAFFAKLPWYLYKMTVAHRRLKHAEGHLQEDFEKRVIPQYLAELESERAVDVKPMRARELYARGLRLAQFLDRYTSELLKPTVMAAFASSEAEQRLAKILGAAEAKHWIQRVVQGRTASSTVGQNQALWEVARGTRLLEQFLGEYGHRCVGEMEMARPRWREDPQFVLKMVEQLRAQGGPSPQEKFQAQAEAHLRDREELEKLIAQKAPAQKAVVMKYVNLARHFFPYRETGKHYWMMGAELMRQTWLALDERLGLRGDIFWLTVEELPDAIRGEAMSDRVAQRKRERELALRISLPEVIFSDDLEAIGLKPKPPEGKEFRGLGVSAGVAHGRAVVVRDPSEAPQMGEDAILVCRSTDPGWTPLFVQAKGLVLERGGLLSHGAVVAREFGLPAVAGIEHATQFIQTGQRVFVDGDNGKVILEET